MNKSIGTPNSHKSCYLIITFGYPYIFITCVNIKITQCKQGAIHPVKSLDPAKQVDFPKFLAIFLFKTPDM